jgi:hypothetical protein
MATGTLGSSARDYHTRQTVYLSKLLTPDVFGTGVAPLKLGTIPANSAIKGGGVVIRTVFSAGDSSFRLGNQSGGVGNANLVAVASGGAALGFTAFTLASGGSNFMPTADMDVYIQGGSAAGIANTAGTGVAFLEFIIP